MTNSNHPYRRKLLKFLLASQLMILPNIAMTGDKERLDPDLEYLPSVQKQLITEPVEQVLDIFNAELKLIMMQMGTTSINQIKPDSLDIIS